MTRQLTTKTCPRCNNTTVEAQIEEEGFRYFCGHCGWNQIVDRPFGLEGWVITIKQALAPIDILSFTFRGYSA